jgi:hypothetical protein
LAALVAELAVAVAEVVRAAGGCRIVGVVVVRAALPQPTSATATPQVALIRTPQAALIRTPKALLARALDNPRLSLVHAVHGQDVPHGVALTVPDAESAAGSI